MSKVVQLKDNKTNDELNPIPALAKPTMIGGVMPVAKTEEMTQSVGMDETGKLFTAPTGGGGEVVLDPNGGLQETASGLGIKRNDSIIGKSGLITSNDGVYTNLASDGRRGTIIGTTATSDMTQPVGITNDGKLVTKPGASEIAIDPNGGLQNSSNGLSIKGDSSGAGGAGIVVGSGGTYIPIASGGTRGAIIGANRLDSQTEPVGIGSDGKIYTNPIMTFVENKDTLTVYIDTVNGSNSNNGLSNSTPVKTYDQLFTKVIPNIANKVVIYVTGEYNYNPRIFNKINALTIQPLNSANKLPINSTISISDCDQIVFNNCSVSDIDHLIRTEKNTSLIFNNSTFTQTYTDETEPSAKSLIYVNGYCHTINIGLSSSFIDINALVYVTSYLGTLNLQSLNANTGSKIDKQIINWSSSLNTGNITEVVLPYPINRQNISMKEPSTTQTKSKFIQVGAGIRKNVFPISPNTELFVDNTISSILAYETISDVMTTNISFLAQPLNNMTISKNVYTTLGTTTFDRTNKSSLTGLAYMTYNEVDYIVKYLISNNQLRIRALDSDITITKTGAWQLNVKTGTGGLAL